MKTKTFKLEVKNISDTGEIEGYCSVFGNVDSYGEIVDKGAFTKTLSENSSVPILWQHDSKEPIGVSLEMREDQYGLYVKGQLNLDTQRGREAHSLLQQKALKGLSIGFSTIKDEFKSGNRHLKELKLYEWSPVTFAANDLAQVTSVKSFKAADFAQNLQEATDREKLWQLRYQIDDALWKAIRDSLEDQEMDSTQKMGFMSTCLEQYKEAMLGWYAQTVKLVEGKTSAHVLEIKAMAAHEIKAGRVLSKASRSLVENALSGMQGASEALSALLDVSEPDDATQDGKGAAPPSEPNLHSDGQQDSAEVAQLISEIKSGVASDRTSDLISLMKA